MNSWPVLDLVVRYPWLGERYLYCEGFSLLLTENETTIEVGIELWGSEQG